MLAVWVGLQTLNWSIESQAMLNGLVHRSDAEMHPGISVHSWHTHIHMRAHTHTHTHTDTQTHTYASTHTDRQADHKQT